MNLSPAELAVLGTLGGAILGGLFTTLIAFINKRTEEKRHFRELIFKSAVEEWKQHNIMSIEAMKAGRKVAMEPLLTYIFQLMQISEKLNSGELTKENVLQKLTEVREFMKEVKKFTAIPKEKE